jgi:hypothetical protein
VKLYCPCTCACVESLGSVRDPLRRFNVSNACGMSPSHRWRGKSLSVGANPAMKWLLNVWMALLAALRWWMYGGAN